MSGAQALGMISRTKNFSRTLAILTLLLPACADLDAAPEPEAVAEATSALLSGEQTYAVASIFYNGSSSGFSRSFASVGSSLTYTSYDQMRSSWPRGAAITYDGQPLPSFE